MTRMSVCGCHRQEVCPDNIRCFKCGEHTGNLRLADCFTSRAGEPLCCDCRTAEIEKEIEDGTYEESD